MYFHKIETPRNFRFDTQAAALTVHDCGSNVFRVQAQSQRWPQGSQSIATLTADEFAGQPSSAALNLGAGGELLLSLNGHPVLQSASGRGFGVCGKKWLWALPYDEGHRFYGMGEKNLGFELSQKRTRFWNTDVFGDFYWDKIRDSSTDPMYASFPVLIIKTAKAWVGIVIDNPFGVFMNTGAGEAIFQPGAGPFIPELFFGSTDGAPDVWIMVDERPDALVRKLQALQGRTPLPPLWALGHQQCRWGYKSFDDLTRIADGYSQHQIPNDGIWLDIDYMDGYRVFTVDPQHFSAPAEQVAAITARGHRVVPILDPGLRQDPAYRPYAEAQTRQILCRTIEGTEYVGYVWPGYTVFPDYSLSEGRAFWKEQVEAFTSLGFGGYWIDMNDPSTGSANLDDMRFGRGEQPHESFHNQYALGMAIATREGLLAARPDERPFIISRSGFLSQARHSALWTGDNMSNEHHMKGSIALSLNLSVSGLPFNGPDVPGFALDASNELMRAWYKLGFLFPFLRNHKISGAMDQEPWTRDAATLNVVRDYIRLRYTLLPYLYQSFIAQAEHGEPMLRPLWYHDPDGGFDYCDDQFFVGPAVLQAPFVSLAATERTVQLPRHATGTRWYAVQSGDFHSAGAELKVQHDEASTPIYLASPSAIALQPGLRTSNQTDLLTVDVLLTIEPGQQVEATYHADDGISFGWQRGERSTLVVKADWSASGLNISVQQSADGYGVIKARVLILSPQAPADVQLNGQPSTPANATLPFAGRELTVLLLA
ncbi:glycoside hydrolase family 31 protein [Chitinimonas sp. BJYL2]|uniref:glycoside hydrolase family 31 protein n=1 Tax=Chitinimonas sp. BJYL2 TaxID=2976696 RepID=UPI0022B53EC1|nr:glycoside hydrolase family 31 protein [Chitinimonas sp. BJYL2]